MQFSQVFLFLTPSLDMWIVLCSVPHFVFIRHSKDMKHAVLLSDKLNKHICIPWRIVSHIPILNSVMLCTEYQFTKQASKWLTLKTFHLTSLVTAAVFTDGILIVSLVSKNVCVQKLNLSVGETRAR